MKFQKKLTAFLIVFVLFLASAMPVYAAETNVVPAPVIKIQYNGKTLVLNPSPKLINGGSDFLVPLKPFCTALKAKPQWANKQLIIEQNGVKTKITIGNKYKIINGTTYVQLSALSDFLHSQIYYDRGHKTIVLINYQYFMDQIKIKAPVFYDYVMHEYSPVNTGEFRETINFAFKFTPHDSASASSETLSKAYDIKGDITITGKMSENSAICNAVINLYGIENTPLYAELGNRNQITFDMIASDKNFYLKSNLLETEIGTKWLQGDFAMLEQDGVTTFKDLKNQQNSDLLNSDVYSDLNTISAVDINTFKEINSALSAMLFLVDNEHFTCSTTGAETIYTWKLNKADLLKLVANLNQISGSSDDMSLTEMLEMKELVDALVFDTTMTITIKDNIPNSETFSFNFQMNIPEAFLVQLTINGQASLFNINTPIPDITPPSAAEVININDEQALQALDSLLN
ncbi:copper amine oxidase N-terminal domain-containing protein [Dehalobacter sp. DCM]|uniref:stalk domain-containing protein n=1 Tax=Dehalobacter sp. DCM TaxID=2907827 RepID=UPI003081810F|nr:copper amine oxidase N-terminal domain-containing protein [Dehalobacter sp. DCM]